MVIETIGHVLIEMYPAVRTDYALMRTRTLDSDTSTHITYVYGARSVSSVLTLSSQKSMVLLMDTIMKNFRTDQAQLT